ncbi:MAG: nickel-dependent hydrogenase large subunit [Verrucomicrobiota bacterium]|nr:nickel-dependent hydrogenase large subunit [Verrucomicrobiota bacterium]
MCFKNLPIEFDESGKMFLRDDRSNAFGLQDVPDTSGPKPLSEEQIKTLLAKNGYIKDVDFDPVTRVAGALAFHAVADLQERKVLTTNSVATLFRGYEVIMLGRDPRDAIFITSRACGVCGGVHSVRACLAVEMALGLVPPPLGVIVRNLMLAMEFQYDHPLHLFLLAGPDYSQAIVQQTNPELWERAKTWRAPGRAWHGYETMAELMTDLNPLTGKLYVEALHMTRIAREAYVVLGGKYPHPQTIVPGGVSTTVSLQTFNEYYLRLAAFFDYAKKAIAIWDDITDFFYEADPRYRHCGERPMNMMDVGIWDDPESYDSTYTNCDTWGERRWACPGVMVDGKLVTTKLTAINAGLEEFVDRSYYEGWEGKEFPQDPLGNPLSPYHPWNKETKAKPEGQNWKERYSWSTSPRWDRQTTEGGAYARIWITAAAKKMRPNPFMESTGHSLKMVLPKSALPERQVECKIPEVLNAFERNRARAYCLGFNAMVAMNDWLKGLDLLKQGKTEVSTPFEIPKKGRQVGVGFWGAGRGWLTHHLVLQDGVVSNYQIITPSTINASPRDPWGNPGAYEQAVLNTPLLETFQDKKDFKGVDILRAIRSFDPCMPCTTHIHAGDRLISREINTCACGADEDEHEHSQ